jgi:universal stress protein E
LTFIDFKQFYLLRTRLDSVSGHHDNWGKAMLKLQRLLVVMDPSVDNQPALNRAKELSKASNAAVHCLSFVYNHACEEGVFSEIHFRDDFKRLLLEERENWLEDQVATVGLHQATQAVVWCEHAYEAAIAAMNEDDFDLVIRSAATHHSLLERILPHEDWNLLRHAPGPVLLVKKHRKQHKNSILCAVDATSKDPGHRAINDNILDIGEQFADALSSQMHIINAYPIASVAFTMLPAASAPNDLQNFLKRQHQNGCDRLAKRYNVPETNIHLIEGDPGSAIVEQGKALDVDLIILGTVAREGMKAVLLGNTAEQVLEYTDADVLAVKPEDGVSERWEEI